MRFYEILAVIMAVTLFCTGFTYGLDREIARRDYEKAVSNKNYNQPIVGCIYKSNCVYYTKMLGGKNV